MEKCQLKKWIELEGSNTLSNTGITNYRIAAIIPDSIIAYMKSRYAGPEQYYGSELSVNVSETETRYAIIGYFYITRSDNKFEISRAIYPLNISVDYEQYLKSKEFIPLNLTIDNLVTTVSDFRQGFKNKCFYGSISYTIADSASRSRSYVYSEKCSVSYGCAYINEGKLYVSGVVPFATAKNIGVSPSVLELAKKACTLNIDKSIENNIVKNAEEDELYFA